MKNNWKKIGSENWTTFFKEPRGETPRDEVTALSQVLTFFEGAVLLCADIKFHQRDNSYPETLGSQSTPLGTIPYLISQPGGRKATMCANSTQSSQDSKNSSHIKLIQHHSCKDTEFFTSAPENTRLSATKHQEDTKPRPLEGIPNWGAARWDALSRFTALWVGAELGLEEGSLP